MGSIRSICSLLSLRHVRAHTRVQWLFIFPSSHSAYANQLLKEPFSSCAWWISHQATRDNDWISTFRLKISTSVHIRSNQLLIPPPQTYLTSPDTCLRVTLAWQVSSLDKAPALNSAPLLNNYLWSQMESKEKRWSVFFKRASCSLILERLLCEKHRCVQVQVRSNRRQKHKKCWWEFRWLNSGTASYQGYCLNACRQTRTTRPNQTTQIQLMAQQSRHLKWRSNEKEIKVSHQIDTVRQQLHCRMCHWSIFNGTWRSRAENRAKRGKRGEN